VTAAFWSQVAYDPLGCWEWTGLRNRFGYGHLSWRGRSTGAHRVAFELANGRPPRPGLVIRHTCDNPPCVRPDHLLEGTYSENARDALDRGRRVSPSWTKP
jgi:hypothetical protein